MSEGKKLRLGQVARKLNVGRNTIINYLQEKGTILILILILKLMIAYINYLKMHLKIQLLKKRWHLI